jgi:hypothetical protein
VARRKGNVTKIVYYDRTERLIAAGHEMRSVMAELVENIADDARPNAPRADSEGHAGGRHAAELIQGEVIAVPEGWEGRVGWTRPAYYLLMHEKGWKFKPNVTPFLRPAVERRRDVR